MALIILNLESTLRFVSATCPMKLSLLSMAIPIYLLSLTMSRCCRPRLNLGCLVVLKVTALVLAGKNYKPRLLAVLSTAFRAFWSLSAGLFPCKSRTRLAA